MRLHAKINQEFCCWFDRPKTWAPATCARLGRQLWRSAESAMPSPFSLLSESPARRRARRAQKAGQPPTPIDELSRESTPRDGERSELRLSAPGAKSLWSGLAGSYSRSGSPERGTTFADENAPVTPPPQSPEARASARRRLQDKSRQHWSWSGPPSPATPSGEGERGLLAGLGSIFAAAESAKSTLEKTLTAGPAEERVLSALRELPLHRAINTWRNGISEKRARARNFKLASEVGVQQWVRQWKLAPNFQLWISNLKAEHAHESVSGGHVAGVNARQLAAPPALSPLPPCLILLLIVLRFGASPSTAHEQDADDDPF